MIPSHDILMGTLRPGRYVGQEWNVAKKDFLRASLRFCLCFPDVYEVGMSHLGIRILYDILNAQEGIACERVFCPWPDFQEKLIEHNLPLSSLESQTSLREFDILGFSVNNELTYTNILSVLKLGGIPFFSVERTGDFPLIIGGGSCMLNPEPIADFFDLFVIGEAEEVIIKIASVCREFKKKHKTLGAQRDELLYELSQLPGIYVPHFYQVDYHADTTVQSWRVLKSGAPQSIQKIFIKNFDTNKFPSTWMVPNIEVIHDRIGVEIMRGCVHRCRFCQARSHFYPVRMRSAKTIISMVKRLYKTSGYETVSLLSLSSSDHPEIESIVKELSVYFEPKAVSIALPSMRAKHIVGKLAHVLAQQKKTGLTFAPEAGSQRLRTLIGKDISLDELLETAREAFVAGYRHLKLYFMIGLPTEQQADLEAIIDVAGRLSMLRKEISGRAADITVSIATFIPKPHTPFQWASMISQKDILVTQRLLKDAARKFQGKLKLDFHNASMSQLEAALSRGHRALSKVIYSAFEKGARFDQWHDYFQYPVWQEAFREHGFDLEGYAMRPFPVGSMLAWDSIESGVEKEYLIEEYKNALG